MLKTNVFFYTNSSFIFLLVGSLIWLCLLSSPASSSVGLGVCLLMVVWHWSETDVIFWQGYVMCLIFLGGLFLLVLYLSSLSHPFSFSFKASLWPLLVLASLTMVTYHHFYNESVDYAISGISSLGSMTSLVLLLLVGLITVFLLVGWEWDKGAALRPF